MAVTYSIHEVYGAEYAGSVDTPTELNNAINQGYWGAQYVDRITLSGKFEGTNVEFGIAGTDPNTFKYLDISGLDTSNVSKLYSIAMGVETLIGVENLDVSNCIELNSVFAGAEVTTLDLSKWDVSNCIVFDSLFEGCTSLTELNLTGWDTSSGEDFYSMFWHCANLRDIKSEAFDFTSVSKPDKTPDLPNYGTEDMFYDCYNLPNYDATKVDGDMAKPVAQGGYFNPVSPTPSDYYRIIYRDKDIKVTYYQGNEGDKIYRN